MSAAADTSVIAISVWAAQIYGGIKYNLFYECVFKLLTLHCSTKWHNLGNLYRYIYIYLYAFIDILNIYILYIHKNNYICIYINLCFTLEIPGCYSTIIFSTNEKTI